MNNEVAFLQIRQKLAAEKWQRGGGCNAEERRGGNHGNRTHHQALHQARVMALEPVMNGGSDCSAAFGNKNAESAGVTVSATTKDAMMARM